jgi:hypothetical protein
MLLTAALGTAMGLNNTAAFMASCVAFVAVSKGMESHLARRRREAAARLLEGSQSSRPAAQDGWHGREGKGS